MANIKIDFNEKKGKIKCLNAVNNGPAGDKNAPSQNVSNFDLYKALEIPYARVHDASFYSRYGGEHTVDIQAVFPNFDADVNDEKSYDFDYTDYYMQTIIDAGTKPFYRLGSKIEHGFKKYGTCVPKDFQKWAEICEHLIRHLNYGWANGHNFGIEYFEIWNEADLAEWGEKATWGGTKDEFFELYRVTARHLKKCFPELKIGGPASCGNVKWSDEFLEKLDGAPLDFFSWHVYSDCPDGIIKKAYEYKEILDKHGYGNLESILNEWNYVRGWKDEAWIHSLESEKGLKGASFALSTMMLSQNAPIDMLMYYDARPCAMNGLFDTDIVSKTLKTYYSFMAWLNVKHDGTEAKSECDTHGIYTFASTGDGTGTILVSRFRDSETEDGEGEIVDVVAENVGELKNVSYFIIDKNNNLTEYKKQKISGNTLKTSIKLTPFATVMLRFTK